MLDAGLCERRPVLPAKLMAGATALALLAVFGLGPQLWQAAGGQLGIDHVLTYDNHGIWWTRYEQRLDYGVMIFEAGGAIWLGDD